MGLRRLLEYKKESLFSKRNLLIIILAMLFWFISSNLLYPIIPPLIINSGYPALLNELFFFFQYILIGIVIGLFGKQKGWLLGLFLGVVITLFFILFGVISNLLTETHEVGYLKQITSVVYSHFIFTAYLIIGGYFGERIKKIIIVNNHP